MERRDVIKTMSLTLGYSLTPAVLTGLMTACTKKAKVDWAPAFFTVKEAYAVEQIVEVIFPKTDIPGAKEVGAHIFVDRFLAYVVEEKKKAKVKAGAERWLLQFESGIQTNLGEAEMSDFEKDLQRHFDISKGEYESIQQMLCKEEPCAKPEKYFIAKPEKYFIYYFLSEVRTLARIGFYASEEIGEKVLSYMPVPGKYQGCIPLEEVGNTWSL